MHVNFIVSTSFSHYNRIIFITCTLSGEDVMNILFYRYGSICEPDILNVFEKMGITTFECSLEINRKNLSTEQRLNAVSAILCEHPIDFIFSINFYPFLSDVCQRLGLLYVCWSVDCPVLELFSASIRNSCNRIFLFDYTQYITFHPQNPNGIFYLPLATNVDRWDQVLTSLSPEDIQRYSSDISFVGSLYHEKSPLSSLNTPLPISQYWAGFAKGMAEAQAKIYGFNFLEEAIPDDFITVLKQSDSNFYQLDNAFTDTDRYVAANYYLGMYASESERVKTLNELAAAGHKVTLYTRSNTSLLHDVDCREGVTTHVEMPKVFHCSKINLNITIKSIQSGLSLRVWDILGCGGFLLSNYQTEIPEYFELGKDLDCYESPDDLKQKVAFYLAHDDIRTEIAHNGYQKVKQLHTYELRIATMLKTLFSNI